jgi:predicted RNase H-like nuclease
MLDRPAIDVTAGVTGDGVIVGVDGAPFGWVAVALGTDGTTETQAFRTFRELVTAHESAHVIAVDIPIGLSSDLRRSVDEAARARLGHHGARVFATPDRDVLAFEVHADALAMLREHGRPGMSAQAFALRRKILEVDALAADRRIHEVHPEVSFLEMADRRPLEWPKKHPLGFLERRALLERHGIRVTDDALRLRRVGADDVLDAAAAAWTAQRIANGEARTLPEDAVGDETGRLVAIWY